MAWWDDIREQQETIRRLAGQIIDTPTSSILEAHRALKDPQDRYAGILRNMEFLGIPGINPAFPLAERAKFLSYSGSLPESMSWLGGPGAADLANFSPAYLQSFKTLNEKVAGFSSLSGELRSPAGLGIASSLQDLMTGAFDELLRDRVISQAQIDLATSTFPIPPADATTEPAFDAWLDAVVEWFRNAAQMLPANRKVVKVLIFLAKAIFTIVLAIPISRIRGPQTRARAKLETEQFAKAQSAIAAVRQQLDALAAREQFEARVVKPAIVRLEPNSKAKRAHRLALGSVVKVLSRRGRWYEIEYGAFKSRPLVPC